MNKIIGVVINAKTHDVLSVLRDFEAFLKCNVDVSTTVLVPGTSTCTQRAVCTGRYVGKTDNVVLGVYMNSTMSDCLLVVL